MTNFVSDTTAKTILRGMARETLANTPSLTEFHIYLERASSLYRNLPKLQRILIERFEPHYINMGHDIFSKALHTFGFEVMVPTFIDTGYGWNLELNDLKLYVVGDKVHISENVAGKITIYGHALERVAQRARLIGWESIRDQLRDASRMYTETFSSEDASVFEQVVIPSSTGAFIGYYGDYKPDTDTRDLTIKTFYVTGQNARVDAAAKMISDFMTWREKEGLLGKMSFNMTMSIRKIILDRLQDNAPWMLEKYHGSTEQYTVA